MTTVTDLTLRPFAVHVPDEDLADLRRRIAAMRWPGKEVVSDTSQGVQLATIRALAPTAAAKGLAIEEREALMADGPDLVEADAHRVDQMLVNLIENAIKYTPSGGAVTVLTWRRDAEVGVTVSDTGPGIPPEDLDHVFDRFFRVDEARRRTSGGSGLGLAICREIVEAHGGRIWVESEAGRGSAFSLALPAAAPAPVVRRLPDGVAAAAREA